MFRFSTREFPPYTYVPSQSPHPRREPGGHSFGVPEPRVDQFCSEQWQLSDTYLYAVDLFNAGYYWESHEQWEAIWHAVGRKGPEADFFKGLIKLAAAGVKLREGRGDGVLRHLRRARELFDSVKQHHSKLCGLELSQLSELAETVNPPFENTLAMRLEPE